MTTRVRLAIRRAAHQAVRLDHSPADTRPDFPRPDGDHSPDRPTRSDFVDGLETLALLAVLIKAGPVSD